MNKKIVILATLLSLALFTLAASIQAAPDTGKSTPFLINGKMPHLAMLVKQQWDNPALKLTEEQKKQLQEVRKETMEGAQALGAKIMPLEQQVAEGIASGKTPKELKGLVDQVAALRAQATMIHLQCIYKTKKILSKEQMGVLTGAATKK